VDVAEDDGGAFAFQAKITFFAGGLGDAVHHFAIDAELDGAVDGHNIVNIPLAAPIAAVFNGFAAFAARIVGDGLDAADAKEFPVDLGDGGLNAIAGVELGPIEFEHLDFDNIWQAAFLVGHGAGPDEDAGIATSLKVHPLDVEQEVLVFAFTAHDADGFAGAVKETFFDAPGIGAGIDVHPAGEVFAIEERFVLGESAGGAGESEDGRK
jgi:hypothetical protein